MQAVGEQMASAMRAIQEADRTMCFIGFQGLGVVCPQCGMVYKHGGWLRRHLIRKRHTL